MHTVTYMYVTCKLHVTLIYSNYSDLKASPVLIKHATIDIRDMCYWNFIYINNLNSYLELEVYVQTCFCPCPYYIIILSACSVRAQQDYMH